VPCVAAPDVGTNEQSMLKVTAAKESVVHDDNMDLIGGGQMDTLGSVSVM
jgi:hypothetical protein